MFANFDYQQILRANANTEDTILHQIIVRKKSQKEVWRHCPPKAPTHFQGVEKPKGPLEVLRPKLQIRHNKTEQPTQQQSRYHKSPCAPNEVEDTSQAYRFYRERRYEEKGKIALDLDKAVS
ncbi:hypothetical protein LXL04_036857 [Taraxacum kok-saghyz]